MPPENQSNEPMPMDLPPKRSKGLVVVLVIVIILAVVAVAGTWFWQSRKLASQKNQDQQVISGLQSQVQQLQKDNDDLKAQLAVDAATQVAIGKTIKGFYDDWLKGIGATPPVAKATLATQAANKGYITSSVVSYINSAATSSDPVVCSSNVPKSYEYKSLTLNNKIAGAVVTFTFESGTSKSNIELTQNGATWQISKITCQQ